MDIIPFQPCFNDDVARLVVGIQQDEFAIDITADQQPDLRDIPGFYQVGAGNFWVAIADGRLVGTISLLDIGMHQGAIRKMFVHRDFRGPQARTAKLLLDTLCDWAQNRDVREVFLGTISKFHAAHRFYEKNGFLEITRAALPSTFPVMTVDNKFYYRHVAPAGTKSATDHGSA
jgi:GNAT superfamily N-acetyltransferase